MPEAKEQKRSQTWQVVAALAVIGGFALIGWWGLFIAEPVSAENIQWK